MSYLPVPPQRSNPATFAALADPFLAALPGFGNVMETLALAASEGSFQGTYAGGTTYTKGQTVVSGGVFYVSLQNANTGNTPASSAAWWYSPLNAFLTASSVIAADKGGTGLTGYTTGDLIYASATTTLAKLASVATGNSLISGGIGAPPSWGKIGLTTHVSGTLPVANGGTGVTASTGSGNNVLATSPTLVTPVLGTPSSGTLTNCTGLPLTTGVTGTLPVANGGTGVTTFTNGQLLIGNTTGNTLTKATLTQGAGITIANGAGTITIATAVPLVEAGGSVSAGTTGAAGVGTNNVIIGVGAGAAIPGNNSVIIGRLAGATFTSANSVAIGSGALGSETGAQASVAVGRNALTTQNVGTGIANNTAVGPLAGQNMTTGVNNTLLGAGAGNGLLSGSANTIIGVADSGLGAGWAITTGSNNTIVGAYAGTTSMASNVVLADGAGTRRFWHDGTGAFVSHTTTASAANAFLDSSTNALLRSTSSLRYKRDVEDLWPDESAKLLKLKPVFYRSLCDADPEAWSYYGVIAEEADKLGLQRLVQYEYAPEDYGEPDENGERWPKPDAQKVPGGFAYDRMTVLLLDLVQRQQTEIVAIKSRLDALEA